MEDGVDSGKTFFEDFLQTVKDLMKSFPKVAPMVMLVRGEKVGCIAPLAPSIGVFFVYILPEVIKGFGAEEVVFAAEINIREIEHDGGSLQGVEECSRHVVVVDILPDGIEVVILGECKDGSILEFSLGSVQAAPHIFDPVCNALKELWKEVL